MALALAGGAVAIALPGAPAARAPPAASLPCDGALVNPASGKCLDDPNSSTTNGTQPQIWSCSGANNQKWTIP